MVIPVPLILAAIGVFWSSTVKLHAVIFGQPVQVPVLWLIGAAVVLALAGFVLLLIRNGRTEGWLRLHPDMAET
jgi:hypothetical protein